MVPTQAAVLRFACAFFIGLSASFLAVALVTGFLGIPPEGLTPLVALVLLALWMGAMRGGRALALTLGRLPGDPMLWRVALFGSMVILAGLALLAARALAAGWLPDLPPPDDPRGWRLLGLAALVFLPLATILSRLGLGLGAQMALRQAGNRTRPARPGRPGGADRILRG